MINRDNWVYVRSFLKYQAEVMQNSASTIKSNWGHLKHLILWADDRPFLRMAAFRPTYPAHMENLTFKDRKLSSAYLTSNCKTCRQFLEWCKKEYPTRFKKVPLSLIETLRPSRARGEQTELHVRQIYTLEEILRIAKCGMESPELVVRRVGVAVAFLFLSGMRIGAFLTLPIGAVDLEHNLIHQLPEMGVATKNSKAAITHLLPIDELWKVVREWDSFIRPKLPLTAYWYVHLDRGGEICQDKPSQENRAATRPNFRKALLALCRQADVEYKSAHKIRHGHVVWALKKCKTMDEFKSVSQNVMHSSVGITDSIYGKLVDDDVRNTIRNLGKEETRPPENLNNVELMEAMIRRILKEKE